MEQYVQEFSREPWVGDADGLYAYDIGEDRLAMIDNYDGHETVERLFDAGDLA